MGPLLFERGEEMCMCWHIRAENRKEIKKLMKVGESGHLQNPFRFRSLSPINSHPS